MSDQSSAVPDVFDAPPDTVRGVQVRWLVGAMVAVMIATGMTLGLRRERRRQSAPSDISVHGTAVDIRTGAPSWGYVSLGKAELGGPIPPAPVPGRVAVDETSASSVSAPLPGRVETVSVRLGERVAASQRLIAVRSAALVDLFHEIDMLRTKEAARTKVAERVRALYQLKAAPEKELQAAEQELAQAQLGRAAAESKLRSLSVAASDGGLYWVTAPRDGVVVERNVLVGQEVGPDRTDPLLTVAELDEVIVTADVPESDVAGLQAGQIAAISSAAAPERLLTGTIQNVGEVVDPVRRMVNVRIRVTNSEHTLRPNSFVQVSFDTSGDPRLLVPVDAVVTDAEQSFVFVQDAAQPQRLARREVVTGRQRNGQVEIVDGLNAGETVVTKGAILLLNTVDLAS